MKRIVIIGIVVIAAIAIWLFRESFLPRMSESEIETTACARRAPMKIRVVAFGQINAKNSEKIFLAVEGQLTIAQLVAEGKSVKKGDVMISFDNGKLKEALVTAEGACKAAETDVEIATKALEIAQQENAETLSQAQLKYSATQMDLEKYEKGELPQQEQKLRLEIEKAESELKQTEEVYSFVASPEVISRQFFSAMETEAKRFAWRKAQITLELSRTELELFKKYTSKVALNAKCAELATARADVAMKAGVNANKAHQKSAELYQKQTILRSAIARKEELQKSIEGTVLRAPADGLVLYGNPDQPWERTPIQVGATVYMNQVLMTLPKLDQLVVKANVPEVDVHSIKIGMVAHVTSDAYRDFHAIGSVDAIGSLPKREDWYSTGTSSSYEVVIDLPPGALEIKPGVSARVEFHIAELQDVLQIPVSAVFTHEGRNIVYVKQRQIEAREVKLKAVTDTVVEVVEGLKEGERVLLYEPEGISIESPQKQVKASADNVHTAAARN